MTTQSLQLYEYSWRILVFYNVTINDLDIVLPVLWENGCSNEGIKEVALAIMNPNSGFTHTQGRTSVMGIGWTSSPSEFQNTLTHEINHLQDDICLYYGLPLSGEIPSSIVGNIAMAMYNGYIKYLN